MFLSPSPSLLASSLWSVLPIWGRDLTFTVRTLAGWEEFENKRSKSRGWWEGAEEKSVNPPRAGTWRSQCVHQRSLVVVQRQGCCQLLRHPVSTWNPEGLNSKTCFPNKIFVDCSNLGWASGTVRKKMWRHPIQNAAAKTNHPRWQE